MRTVPAAVLLITTSPLCVSPLTKANAISVVDELLMISLSLNVLPPFVLKIPVPVLFIIATPLKMLLPKPVLVVTPVLVMVAESAKVVPLNIICGDEKFTFPPKLELGPKCKFAVPVSVKL